MRLQREARTLTATRSEATCDILAKNLATSSLCPENSPEARLKGSGLQAGIKEQTKQKTKTIKQKQQCNGLMVERISRQHNIESLAWLLLITTVQVYM